MLDRGHLLPVVMLGLGFPVHERNSHTQVSVAGTAWKRHIHTCVVPGSTTRHAFLSPRRALRRRLMKAADIILEEARLTVPVPDLWEQLSLAEGVFDYKFRSQALLCLAFSEDSLPRTLHLLLPSIGETRRCGRLLTLTGKILLHQFLTEQLLALYPEATMAQLNFARTFYRKQMNCKAGQLRKAWGTTRHSIFETFLGAVFVEGGKTALLSYFINTCKFPARIPVQGEEPCSPEDIVRMIRYPRRTLLERMEMAADNLPLYLEPSGSWISFHIDRTNQKLIYHFQNPKLLLLVFLHFASWDLSRKEAEQAQLCRKALMWIGDSLLQQLLVEELQALYPQARFGHLQSALHSMMSRSECARRMSSLGLMDSVVCKSECGNTFVLSSEYNCNMLAESYEALLGAVMLDGGRPAVARFFADTHTFSKDIAGELGQKEH